MKKFIISVVAVFVLSMLIGFVVHGVLLGTDYVALPNLIRAETDQMQYMPYMLIAHILIVRGPRLAPGRKRRTRYGAGSDSEGVPDQ